MRIVQVDAFTAAAFGGNPAAVCVLPRPRDDRWMQAVAREMNLSETAFLHREHDAWRLRWFTPLVEVDLCGHATLAAAHVLWEDEHLPHGQRARFLTRSGELGAERRGDWIELDFPAEPARPADPPPGLLDALRVRGTVARNRMDYLVEVADDATVRGLDPDFTRLRSVSTRGVIVTARGTPPYDFVSRFFAPAAGVDEDPVTGSAHCARPLVGDPPRQERHAGVSGVTPRRRRARRRAGRAGRAGRSSRHRAARRALRTRSGVIPEHPPTLMLGPLRQ